MKLFVFEYITSGALSKQSLPSGLAAEGDAMLKAMLNDISLIDDIELVYMRDQRLDEIEQHAASCEWFNDEDNLNNVLQQLINFSDYTLAIAPETDNVLFDITALIPTKKLLGCDTKSIKLSTDKQVFAQHLQSHNISTANTQTAQQWLITPTISTPVVIKPYDGAGCGDTHVFQSKNAAIHYLQNLTSPQLKQQLVQEYINGTAASLSLFIDVDSDVHVLNINQQFFKQVGTQLHFTACHNTENINDLVSADSAYRLATNIVKIVDGLFGFVGIDFIITDNELTVIELNPRLTTAYLDLHKHLDFNPATLLTKAINH